MAANWFNPLVQASAAAHQLDPLIVHALIQVESAGRPSAWRAEPQFVARYRLAEHPVYGATDPLRWGSSYGLMQIMAVTAYEQGWRGEPEELFLPTTNLEYGCKYLARCFQWARGVQAPDKDILLSALAAYNGGRNSAQRPPRPRNLVYAFKVLARVVQE